jgi:hypothetical protein
LNRLTTQSEDQVIDLLDRYRSRPIPAACAAFLEQLKQLTITSWIYNHPALLPGDLNRVQPDFQRSARRKIDLAKDPTLPASKAA